MSIHNAEFYAKRILSVSGMSPQIVTETLYGVAIKNPEPFIPTEIHVITTQSGAMEARLQLLHPVTGKFHQCCRDYNLPNIHFPEDNIHVIRDEQGQLLDDIKTPRQNEAAADFITSLVSELTRDQNSALHVSIAGGRNLSSSHKAKISLTFNGLYFFKAFSWHYKFDFLFIFNVLWVCIFIKIFSLLKRKNNL